MTWFLGAVLWVLLTLALALVVGRGIRIGGEAPGTIPAHLDPRASLTALTAPLIPSRERLTATGKAVAWLLVAALLVSGLLFASTQDFIAAGGVR